ncbi:arginase [mine drainage metagenome]|uniref:Arginase n=1 Tax=mine drainage metagenome TaxID=410659 RepID=A0A1J5PZH5_9ZZZZ
MTKTCILIGAPIDSGQKRAGCLMGPAAYRTAGIAHAITDLGHKVIDRGDAALPTLTPATCPNPAVHSLAETIGWPTFFLLSIVVALPALGLLWWLKPQVRALEVEPDAAPTAA